MIHATRKISSLPVAMDSRGVGQRANVYLLVMTGTALKVLIASHISIATWENAQISRRLEILVSIAMSAEGRPLASLTTPDRFQEYVQNT
jgi:hypothetical protein